mmetsp:Transcript_85693/g.128384  ORF Transcript_85693/g.128384 Transcript_85693/m.128384 type:complete len:89 (+) Transcript_85693:706-972(+)
MQVSISQCLCFAWPHWNDLSKVVAVNCTRRRQHDQKPHFDIQTWHCYQGKNELKDKVDRMLFVCTSENSNERTRYYYVVLPSRLAFLR